MTSVHPLEEGVPPPVVYQPKNQPATVVTAQPPAGKEWINSELSIQSYISIYIGLYLLFIIYQTNSKDC